MMGEVVFQALVEGKPLNLIGKLDMPHTMRRSARQYPGFTIAILRMSSISSSNQSKHHQLLKHFRISSIKKA
jgi:hypothetical protein